MEKQSLGDAIRQRIWRQSTRLAMSTRNENHSSEWGNSSNAEDSVLILNRFRHSNSRVSSMPNFVDKRKSQPQNESTNSSGTNLMSGEHSQYSQCNAQKTSNNDKHSSLEDSTESLNKKHDLNDCKNVNIPTRAIENTAGDDLMLTKETKETNFCKACGNTNSIIFQDNKKICRSCGAFSLIKFGEEPSSWSSDRFYQQEKKETQVQNCKPSSEANTSKLKSNDQTSKSKNVKCHKRKMDDAMCLTISSDEEDENIKQKESQISENCGSQTENRTAAGDDHISDLKSYKIPKFSDRMKGKCDKKVPKSEETETSSVARRRPTFDLPVDYVQFGSLPGKAISFLSLNDCALRVDIECSYRLEETKTTTEKYKLALSSVEIDKIIVIYDRRPLMICAIPTKLYSDVVNAALSMCVLDSQSSVAAKRQMIFVIDQDPSLFRNIINCHLADLQKISKVYNINNSLAGELLSFLPARFAAENTVTRSYSLRTQAKHASQLEDVRTMFVYPPPPSKRGIAITTADIKCLDPGTYLNDTIIDFYLTYLVEEKLSSEMKEKTHLFSSYFYTRLTMKLPATDKSLNPAERMHSQVKKWTRNVDIFKKDFIIIPVNEHAHWFLAVICFPSLTPDLMETKCNQTTNEEKKREDACTDCQSKTINNQDRNFEFREMEVDEANTDSSPVIEVDKNDVSHKETSRIESPEISSDASDRENKNTTRKQPCILVFDSLIAGGRSRLFTNLRQYLTIEWKENYGKTQPDKTFDKNTIPGSFPKIPLQTNDCDCGVFVLQFAESFFENPIVNFKAPIKKEDWFTKERIDKKRFQIKTIIEEMEKKKI